MLFDHLQSLHSAPRLCPAKHQFLAVQRDKTWTLVLELGGSRERDRQKALRVAVAQPVGACVVTGPQDVQRPREAGESTPSMSPDV